MILKKTLYNIGKTKNSFFNLNTGSWVNGDLYKKNLLFSYWDTDRFVIENYSNIGKFYKPIFTPSRYINDTTLMIGEIYDRCDFVYLLGNILNENILLYYDEKWFAKLL
jgi:hypothetical protein